MSHLAAVLDRLDQDLDSAVGRLFELIKFESISTDPAFAQACQDAAAWHASDLETIGFNARVAQTEGHPMVVGHRAGPEGTPHVLFYGHYDVQPVDPLDLWTNGKPFEPAILTRPDGSRFLHGRGVADDKGQTMTFIEACRALVGVSGGMPCSATILLEGEEESGGKSLPPFLEANRGELTADLALICDTGMFDAQTPAITTMLRGNTAEQVTIHAASRDLHSGIYGGAAANPIHVLTRVLSGMHDDTGRIMIPGFYDGVHALPDAIKKQWETLGFSSEKFLGDVGLSIPSGAHGYSALEHLWARPTAEVNGIWGGYIQEGFKTVIPAEAHAKISFRLVGDQDPEDIRAKFRAYIEQNLPADCRASFVARGGGHATVMPLDNPAFEKARVALSEEWGKEAAFIGSGGSIPVVGELKARLGMDSLLIGFGLEDDNLHSPNEKYEMTSFTKGARSWARVLTAIAG